jgi:hypothetical protein
MHVIIKKIHDRLHWSRRLLPPRRDFLPFCQMLVIKSYLLLSWPECRTFLFAPGNKRVNFLLKLLSSA